MKTEQPSIVYIPSSPRYLPAPELEQDISRSRWAYAALVAQHVALTIAFVFFCIGTAVALWYAMAVFANVSYRTVAFFLMLIFAGNVTGKYVVWCIKH
jgi:hypothetical protein